MSSSASWSSLFILLVIFFAPVGAWVVIGLLRGRGRPLDQGVGNLCGKCGYSVRGLTSFICPECGSDLREVGINKPAAPPRRPMILIVVALVLAGLAFLGVWRYGLSRPAIMTPRVFVLTPVIQPTPTPVMLPEKS